MGFLCSSYFVIVGAKPHILPFFVVIAHSKVRSAKRIVWRENQTELSDFVGGAGADPPTSKKMTIFLMPFALSESINLIRHELELWNVSNLGGWLSSLYKGSRKACVR